MEELIRREMEEAQLFVPGKKKNRWKETEQSLYLDPYALPHVYYYFINKVGV